MVAGTLTYDTKMDTKGLQKGVSSIKNIVAGLGITKIISSAFNVLNGSIDGAINRIDALNNFPKVMANLGIGADESKEAIEDLSRRLQGIPTTLDDASIAVQRFTSKNGDVKKSVEIFDAVNNAILAGGANSQIQASALEQLSQAYAKGKPDMMEWRTLQMAMPAQLKQVALAMGTTTDQLGEGLRNGKISMDDFIDTIIKLNKEGTGEFKAFSEQAKNSTGGIKTSITNAKTAVIRGVAGIVTAINDTMVNMGLGSIAENISKIGKLAENGLKWISEKIKEYAPIIINKIIDIVKRVKDWIQEVNLKQTIQNAWEIIKNFASQVVKAIKPIYDFIKNNIIPIITKMFKAFSNIKLDSKSFEKFNKILKELQPIIMGVVAGFIAMKTAIIVVSVIQKIQAAFKTFTTFLSTMTMPTMLGLIGVITAVITAIALFATRSKEDLDGARKGLVNSNKAMTDSFKEYSNAINNAEGKLAGFNTSLFATEAEQTKLESDLKSIQDDITKITSAASSERRDLTDREIKKLEEYFEKLDELRDKQIGIYQSMQEAIGDQAETEAKRVEEAGGNVTEALTDYVAKAKDNAQTIKNIAEESANADIANLNQIYNTEEKRSSEAYKEKYNRIIEERDARISAANETTQKILNMSKNHNEQQAGLDNEALNHYLTVARERNTLSEELDKQQQKAKDGILKNGVIADLEYRDKINKTKDEIGRKEKELTATMSNETRRRIGIQAAQIIETQKAGGKLTDTEIQTAQNIIEAYQYMDEESRAEMKEMVDGLMETLEKENIPLTNAAQDTANGMSKAIGTIKDKTEGIGTQASGKLIKGLVSEAENKKGEVSSKIGDIKATMSNAMSGVEQLGFKAGEDYGQGIQNGLNYKTNMIAGTAKGIGAIVDLYTRQGMEARSPSKKAYRTGTDYIAGLVNAIKDGEQDVYAIAEDLGDTMVTELSKAVNIEAGKTTAQATLNNNVNKSFVFNASFNGNVELDNKKVGRILAPNISQALKVGGL